MQIGDVIDDCYVVERFLAGGGMGRVYVARDRRLDRRVAVKLLHADLADDEEAGLRFQREAQMLSRIAHPNFVAIHGFGRHHGAFYIAMELVDGPNLDDILKERGQLGVDEAIGVARQVAGALAEAHAVGVIHRDIKPGNILVRRLASGAMLVKVADFGLARAFSVEGGEASSVTGSARLLGTPAYMPPEQIQNAPLDGRADLYALAVLTFRMLTGSLPIYRSTTQGLLIAHLVDDPAHLPTLDGVEGGVREAIDVELQRALSKRADDRHANANAFAEALKRAVGGSASGGGNATTCPTCDHRGQPGASYCEACGAALPLPSCPACGSRRHGERWFCAACGTSLRAPARWLFDESDAAQPHLVAAVLCARGPATADPAKAGRLASIVERGGGRMLAALGQECVAAFGLGGMRDGELEAASECALAWLAAVGREAPAGVGVALGSLTTRAQAVAWGQVALLGEPVEVARAAASAALDEGGALFADGAAWRELRRRFHGKGVASWTRVGQRRDTLPGQPSGAARDAVPVVGRFAALDEIAAMARNVSRRRSLAVLAIVGERGSGRSVVMREGLTPLGQQGWRTLTTSAMAHSGSPWQPFVDLLHQQLPERATQRADAAALPVPSRQRSLAARIAALRGLSDDGEDKLQRRVDSLLRLGGGDARTLDLRSARPATDAEQAAAFEAYVAFVVGVVEDDAAVLAIDDVDAARGPSLELLAHLIRELSARPMLVALTVRREHLDAVLDALPLPASRIAVVDVPPLDEHETRELIAELLGGVAVPAGLARRVHEFAGGLPAHIEEAVEALIGAGVVVQDGDGYRVAQLDAIDAALERGLSGLVLDRVGRLPPAERAILEAVALAGDGAARELVSAMLDRAVSDEEFDGLLRAGHLRLGGGTRFGGQRVVQLRQSLVRDVLCDALPRVRRVEMHRRASDWLTAWRGARPAGYGALLARHHLGAGNVAEAARALLKSAQESMRAVANREAFETLGQAIEAARSWLGDGGTVEARTLLLDALLLRGELGAQTGQLDAASEAVDAALAVAEAMGDAGTLPRARARLVRGELDSRRGDYDGAAAAFAAAAEVRNLGSLGSGVAALATGRHAMVLLRNGDQKTARELALAGLQRYGAAAPTSDVERGLGRLETVLGHLANRDGDVDAALAHFDRARVRFERGGDRIGAAMAAVSMGNAAFVSGDLAVAEQRYCDAVAACEAIEYVQGLTAARINLGNVLLDRGAIDDALEELLAAEGAMRRTQALDLLPEALRLIALCRLRAGNVAAALSAATEAVAIARDIGNVRHENAAVTTLDEIEARAFAEPDGDASSDASNKAETPAD